MASAQVDVRTRVIGPLRDLGRPYSALEKRGATLMVVDCDLRFRASARYDDVLVVRTRIERRTRVRVEFAYEVVLESVGTLCCEGRTTLASIGSRGRPAAFPVELIEALDAWDGRAGGGAESVSNHRIARRGGRS